MMPLLACPLCRAELTRVDNSLRCPQGHSYDRAKQGYWNLLLVQKKRSKDPGDNAAMVQARRQFLAQGHYDRLSGAINAQLLSAMGDTATPRLLDMGCGEGFYTARMEQALNQADKPHSLIGLDISKHAVRAACSRSKSVTWLVASGADMPVPDGSLDGLTVLFSRLMPEAFARTLKANGTLLIAWPGERHLIELREQIYDSVRPSHYDPVALLEPWFEPVEQTQVSYPFRLEDNASIQTLLGMTPHSQRMKQAVRERFDRLEQLALTLDVNIGLFTRRCD